MPFMRAVSSPETIGEIPLAIAVMEWLSITDTNRFLILAGSAVLILFITGNLFLAFVTWASIAFARRISYTLATKLYKVYFSQNYSFFLQRNSSELVKNLFGETSIVANSIVQPVMQLLAEGVLSAAIVAFLIITDPNVAIIAASVIGGGYVFIYLILRTLLSRASRRKVKYNKERYSLASESLGAVKEVKLRGLEQFYYEQFSKASNRLEKAKGQIKSSSKVPRYFLEILAFGGMLLVVLILFAGDYETSSILPLVSVYAISGYRLLPSMQKVFAAFASIRGSQASIELLYKEINLGAENNLPSPVEEPLSFKSAFSLSDISFSYEGSDIAAVSKINIEVEKNHTVGIAGPTGCGKTTLVDVILGLLEPQEGKIECDGVEIIQENVRSWRANFGYVPQSIFISDTTIAKNIAFGLPDEEIDMEQVRFAARLASLDDYVESLKDGYETVLGERGVRMSGGQRQRVGIARALYRNPPILVFDEATSALDNTTEKVVMEAISQLSHQKTIIIIAHRLSTLDVADNVVLMDRGRVVDSGPYEDLKKRHPGFWSVGETSEGVGQ
ncbi:MAG: ABC transporter ATP-binding protein/permease [Spirochaetaceae bacterium]|nr:ABC transporter ATP-binding protein/permease [Spirochaetaceae bacterium]MCF7949358.1 ABC transporter ATP-binding protein/permease [Spirochaetia bacterium]